MVSPDTIILLIVDYHAAIGGGGKNPCPLAYASALDHGHHIVTIERSSSYLYIFPPQLNTPVYRAAFEAASSVGKYLARV